MKYYSILPAGLASLLITQTSNADIKNNIRVESNGGTSRVTVNVNTDVNTGNKKETTTNESSVQIHQTGEGTASVRINGKEYNASGSGETTIRDNSVQSGVSEKFQQPTASATAQPTPSPVANRQSGNTPPGLTVVTFVARTFNDVTQSFQLFFETVSKIFR